MVFFANPIAITKTFKINKTYILKSGIFDKEWILLY